MKLLKTLKRVMAVIVLLLICFAAFWMWRMSYAGISNRQILDAVREEGAETRRTVNERSDALSRKLDTIEAKLDKLINMATPRLPDNMTPAQ